MVRKVLSHINFLLLKLHNLIMKVYKSGGTIQGKDLEITAEQIQRELGLGVHS